MTGKGTEYYDESNAAPAWWSFYNHYQIEMLIASFSSRLKALERAVLVTQYDVEK